VSGAPALGVLGAVADVMPPSACVAAVAALTAVDAALCADCSADVRLDVSGEVAGACATAPLSVLDTGDVTELDTGEDVGSVPSAASED
jgi:hypothetical protein